MLSSVLTDAVQMLPSAVNSHTVSNKYQYMFVKKLYITCYGIGYVFCRLFTSNTTLTIADTSVAPSYVRRYVPSVTALVTLRSALSSVVTLIETATSGSTTSSSV